METTYTVNVSHDKHGNPESAYISVIRPGSQQHQWLADIEFGPFDTWTDTVHWARRVLSLDMDALFT